MERYSKTYSVQHRTGVVALLSGEGLSRSMNRTLKNVDADGRRTVFVIANRWSLWTWVCVIILSAVTLGLWCRAPGYLLVTEPADRRTGSVDDKKAVAAERKGDQEESHEVAMTDELARALSQRMNRVQHRGGAKT